MNAHNPTNITPESHGLRAWYMDEARSIESQYGFSTSNFTLVPVNAFEDILRDDQDFDPREIIELVDDSGIELRTAHSEVTNHFAEVLKPYVSVLQDAVSTLGGDRIIVRASPLDEVGRQELSFAGAYKGYMPVRPGDRASDLLNGTAAMLAGRYTRYGNAYYRRHSVVGDRKVGAIYMEPFMDLAHDVPLFYGTAYIAGDHIRNEYQLEPVPGVAQRDPRIYIAKGQEEWTRDQDNELENDADFFSRMNIALRGLQSHFRKPLDVEYLVDPKGDLYVVQVRALSGRHLSNWRQLDIQHDSMPVGNSAIVNTIGTVEGVARDLRNDQVPSLNEVDESEILVISHEANGGTNTEHLFTTLSKSSVGINGLKVVIDHGTSRRRDHLQFAMGEDPAISFITHAGDGVDIEHISNGDTVSITSNGLDPVIKVTR